NTFGQSLGLAWNLIAMLTIFIYPQDLTRLNLTHKLGSNQIKGAGFRREHPTGAAITKRSATQHQRSKTIRIASRNQTIMGEQNQRIGTYQTWQSFFQTGDHIV